ncbi:hypothetical protein CB1_000077002 [Camelus ferus]|nr:hypothetical protein CB1_000077002 [Camelus ferus]
MQTQSGLPGGTERRAEGSGTRHSLHHGVSEGEKGLEVTSVLLSTLHAFPQGSGLDLRMQIRPAMGARGAPPTPEDRSALRESPWSSGYTGPKVAVQIQRVATLEPVRGLPNLWVAGGCGLPTQDPAWPQEVSTGGEAVAPGVLTACLQHTQVRWALELEGPKP